MPAALALLLAVAAASLGRLARCQPQQLTSASRVCVENRGTFMLDFQLWNTANNMLSAKSNSFPGPAQFCLDLWMVAGVEPGTPVVTIVHALNGMSHSLQPVLYSPASDGEAATANFACAGSMTGFSCTLNGESHEDQPGALVPARPQLQVSTKGICVTNGGAFRMRARLWDTATGNTGEWSRSVNIAGSECIDGGSLEGVASGHPLVLQVATDGPGDVPMAFQSVLYDPDASASAQFFCSAGASVGWGWTSSYECQMQGAWRRLRGAQA